MRILLKFLFISIFIVLLAGLTYAEKGESLADSSHTDLIKTFELKTKSPMGALFRSIVLPGWGQLYNQKYFKSALVFGVETTFLALMIIEWDRMSDHKQLYDSLPLEHPDKFLEYEQYKFYEDRKNLFLWSVLATVFVSMFDAYVDAHLYDFDKEMERIGFKVHPHPENELSFRFSINF
ncbi:MAG: DUF5683 domain-containing protein [candidate division Zixibacteria bacterium]|nr:DUF5683 domain-containing protein [candidate division Zixibacteria bacterium]